MIRRQICRLLRRCGAEVTSKNGDQRTIGYLELPKSGNGQAKGGAYGLCPKRQAVVYLLPDAAWVLAGGILVMHQKKWYVESIDTIYEKEEPIYRAAYGYEVNDDDENNADPAAE